MTRARDNGGIIPAGTVRLIPVDSGCYIPGYAKISDQTNALLRLISVEEEE